MDSSQLYVLRYKKGMASPQTGFLLAESLEQAEAVGHAYCDAIPGCRYIHVYTAILADASILGDRPEVARTTTAPGKAVMAATA